MAFRLPLFGWYHAAAQENATLFSPNPATARPLSRLADYRTGTPFQFDQVLGGHQIELDRGAPPHPNINRMVIPSGHNMAGETLTVSSSIDDIVYNQIGVITPLTSETIDLELTDSTEQFVKLEISGNGRWEFGELFYTNRTSTSTRGPDTPWDATPFFPQVRRPFASGDAVTILGPERIRYEFDHNMLSGQDLDVWDDLHTGTQGGAFPFYLWPPDDADDPIFAAITRWDRGQENPVPGVTPGLAYLIRAAFVEVTW